MTHTSTEQPEALRLARWLEHRSMSGVKPNDLAASNELRRLHARILELEAATVKLPSEYAGWFKWDKISQCWHPQYSKYAETYAKVQGWQKLYTEQQVIDLLKSVGVPVEQE